MLDEDSSVDGPADSNVYSVYTMGTAYHSLVFNS